MKTEKAKKTKFICPKCKDRYLVYTEEKPRVHCEKCGFIDRRVGNTMIDDPHDLFLDRRENRLRLDKVKSGSWMWVRGKV
jgi:ribosomal protein S27AE